MAGLSFERFSPKKRVAAQATGDESPSRSAVVLANAPQPTKILQDLIDCIETLKKGFEDDGSPIDDNNQTLHRLCAKLEYLLQTDMKEKKSLTGRKKEYWDYFCECLGPLKGVNDGIKYVKTTGDYKTALGRGRGFLRFCLVHQRLADSVQQCCVNGKVTSGWYHPKSIWLQHDKSSFLIGALYDLNDLIFDLAPRGYDLDNAWPSFARKHDGQQTWSLTERARTMSISSLSSIGLETPTKHDLSSTPNEMQDYEHLVQELAISGNSCSDMKDKIEALEQQKVTFQQSLAESKGEMNMLETQLKELQKDHKELQATHREMEKNYDQLKMESAYKDKDGKTLETAYETKFTELISEKDKFSEQMRLLEEDFQLAQENLQITLSERDKSNEANVQLEQKMINLNIELDAEKQKFQETALQFDGERKELEKQISSLTECQTDLVCREHTVKDELKQRDMIVDNLERKVSAFNKGFQWLNSLKAGIQFKEIEDLEASASLILKDVSYLMEGLQGKLETTAKEKKELNDEFQRVSNELSEFQGESSTFKDKSVALDALVVKLQENEEKLNVRIVSLEKELSTQVGLCNEKKDECSQKEKDFQESKTEIGQLQDKIERMKETLNEKLKDIDEVKHENSRFQNDLQKTNEFYNMATKSQSDLMERLSSQEQMIQQKGDKLMEALEREKNLIAEKNSVERKNDSLQSKLDELTELNCKLEAGHEEVKTENDKLKKETDQNKEIIAQLDSKNSDLLRQIHEWERELETQKLSITDRDSKAKHQLEEHQIKIKELENTVRHEKDKLEKVTLELNDSRNEHLKKDNDIRTLEQKQTLLETNITSSKATAAELYEKYENTERELNEKVLAYVSLNKDMENKIKEENSLKEEKDQLKAELKTYQNQFYEKQSEVLLLQEKLERSYDELERTKEFYTKASKTESDLSARFSVLENSLQDKDKRISELTQTEKTQAVEISKLLRDIDDALKRSESLQSDMSYLKKGFEEKDTQIDDLKLEIGNLNIKKESLLRKQEEHFLNETEQNKIISDISEKYDAVLLHRSDLEQDMKNAKLKENETDKENRILEQKVFEMEQKEKNLNEKIDHIKSEFDSTMQEKERLEQKIKELEVYSIDNQEKIKQLNANIDEVVKEKEHHSEELFQLNKVVSGLHEDLTKLGSEYDSLSKEKFELEERSEDQKRNLQKVLDEYNTVTAKYENLFQEKLTLMDSLKRVEENESINITKLSKLEQAKNELEERNKALSSEVTQYLKLNNELQNHVVELEKQVEELTEKGNQNSDAIENFKHELFTTEQYNQKLSDDLLVLSEKQSNNVDTIQKLEEYVKNLELEKENIHGNLSMKCVEVNELQAKYDDFQSENSCLVQEYDLLQQSFNDLKITEEVVRAKLSEMTSERDELSADLLGIKELLKSLEVQLHEASIEKEALIKGSETLASEVETLQCGLTDMLRDKTETEKQFDASCNENERLSTEIETMTDKQILMTQEIEKMNAELQKMEKLNSESEKVILELKGDSERLHNEKEMVEQSITDIEVKMKEERNVIENLEKTLSEKNRLVSEQVQKLDKLEQIESAYTKSVEECDELHNQLDKIVKEKQNIISQNENKELELMVIINDFKQERQEMLVTTESDKRQTKELESTFKQHIQSANNLQVQIDNLEEDKKNLTKELNLNNEKSVKEVENLLAEKAILFQENKTLLEQNTDIEQQKNEIKETCRMLEVEKLEQVQMNVETSDQLMKCEKQLKELEEKIMAFESAKISDEDRLEQCLTELELEKQKCNEVMMEFKNAAEQLKLTTSELESAILEKQNLEEMFENLNLDAKSNKQQLNDLQLKISKCNSEISDLTNSKHELETHLTETVEEKKKMENEIEKQNSIQNETDTLKNAVKANNEEIASLSKTIDELQTEIVNKSEDSCAEISKIKTEMESYTAEISNLNEELSNRMLSVNELEKHINEIKEDLEKQTKLNESLTQTIDKTEKEKCELKEEISKHAEQLDDKLNNLEENNKRLKISEEQLMTEVKELNESVEKLTSENSVLNAEAEKYVHYSETQSSELEDTRTKLMSLELQLKNNKDEQELKAQDSEAEVDLLRQEIAALEFQLSSKQLDDDKMQGAAVEEEEFRNLKDNLMEQEALVEHMQQEMGELRKIAQSYKEQELHLQNVELQMENKDKENSLLRENLSKLEEDLNTQANTSSLVKSTLTDEKTRTEEIVKEKDAEINQLKDDLEEVKKKLVKLLKEKDNLWQKTDRLSYQQKLQTSEKWMDDYKVTHCLGCNTEFSFTLRKHHCRLCGRIFCNNCSGNYVQAAHSSKKSRSCTACFVRYTTPLDEQDSNLESDVEQSVEIPKRQIIGQKSPMSMISSNSDLDTSINESMISSSSQQQLFHPEPSSQVTLIQGGLDTTTSSTEEVTTAGNETDEDKLKDTASAVILSDEKGDSGEDRFHVISDEEVQRSLSISGDHHTAMPDDPNMTCSMYISMDELHNEEVNSQNEIWIKAGKSFAVPVIIEKMDSLFGWEFSSYPKDVVFSVTYRNNPCVKFDESQTIVPPCKCDSHKQMTKGELTAKQPGVYTLVFDNTYSRMTSKRVNYTLLTHIEDT